MPGPVASWNLHPGEGTWVEVHVWLDVESMRDATEHRLQDGGREHLACFLGKPYRFRGDDLITRKLGEIHLVRGEFGAGIVAHELQHFITQYSVRLNWDTDNVYGEWETIAYLAGDLTNQFWNGFYEREEIIG